MTDLVVVKKNKRVDKLVRCVENGDNISETLIEINKEIYSQAQDRMLAGIVFNICISLWVATTGVNQWYCIGTLFGGAAFVFISSFSWDSLTRLKEEKLLSYLTTEDLEKLKKKDQENRKLKQIWKLYHSDFDLFMMTHLGFFNYELGLRIKYEMSKQADKNVFLSEIISPDSKVIQNLLKECKEAVKKEPSLLSNKV